MSVSLPAKAGQSGMALLAVLWIIGAGSLIVATLSLSARSSGAVVGAGVQVSRISAGLEAGLEIAVTRLIDANRARRWLADGRPRPVNFADMALVIQVTDANSLVDLNKSSEVLLYNLYKQVVGSAEGAERFRDRVVQARDQSPDRRRVERRQIATPIAERRALVRRPFKAGTTTGDPAPSVALYAQTPAFVDVSQIRRLMEMTGDTYARLRPYLTVYSKDGRINPATAPKAILAAVPGLESGAFASLNAATQPSTKRRASRYVIEDDGPAYIIKVSARRQDGKYPAGREYVVAMRLDADAPYRVLSSRPLRTTEARE